MDEMRKLHQTSQLEKRWEIGSILGNNSYGHFWLFFRIILNGAGQGY